MALRIHLDASTKNNGPLRVIPHSHREGVLNDSEVFEMAKRAPSVECLSGRGGVVVMRPLLIHASSKVKIDAPRRVLHIEYADNIKLSEDAELAVV